MQHNEIIHDYIKSLSKYLSRLEKSEAEDVIREIESHIYDVLESQPGQWEPEEILEGFGSPRDLAAQYVDHMVAGTPPPKGFKAIQTVKKGATKSLYYVTGFLGYWLSLTFFIIALFKPFSPDTVGLWVSEHGESIVVGIMDTTIEGTNEILGWWIIPIFLILGFASFYFTKRLLSVLKEKV